MSEASTPERLADDMQAALELSSIGVARFFFNSFTIGASLTDVSVVFKQGDQPVALGAVPFSVAKQLAQNLLQQIGIVETALGLQFPTLEELQQRANKAAPRTGESDAA